MKWVILRKKAIIPLIIVLIIGSPVSSAFANSGGAFSFFPQGPISPKSELAIRHQTPCVTMDSLGNTYAVWADYRRGNRDIYFAERPPGGPWQENVKVNDDTGTAPQSWPDIVVDPTGNTYAVWEDLRNGTSDIYFAFRPKGGAWEANTKLNHETGNYYKGAPAIAVDAKGNAYAVWNDSRNGNGDIYFSYRPAGGGWQTEEKVNKDSGNAQQSSPRIASDPNGNVMVVWQDDRNGNEDIYSAYRPFGGSWSAEALINNDGDSYGQFYPDVAFLTVDGYPTFMAVWQATHDIYFAINVFGNWGALQGKVNDISSITYRPRIAADQAGTAYVVWEDHRDGFERKDVYFSYRTPGIFGVWSSNKKINDDGRPPVSQISPSIAVNPVNGSAFAVWEDDRLGSYNIFASFCPGGGNWGENLKINDDNAGQRLQSSPAVALDAAGNAFAWWVGRSIRNTFAEPSQNDIFFFFRPRGGTWQAQGTINDVPSSVYYYPGSLVVGAVDSLGNAVTAWLDIRNGRQDIYSSYRPFGGTWQKNLRVNSNDHTALGYPGVLLDEDGNAYAAWSGYSQVEGVGLYFSICPAGGDWQAPEKIDMAPPGLRGAPSLAIGTGGTVYVLWEGSPPDIFFSFRPPGGSWQSNEKVNNDAGNSDQKFPKMALDGQGNAYALWEDDRNGNADVYFSYRPYGQNWQINTIVNQDILGFQKTPALAVNTQGDAYAVWVDLVNKTELFFSYRRDGGTWSTRIKVNADQGEVGLFPAIAVNARGTVLVAWEDYRYGEPSIFYSLVNEINFIHLPLIVKP